MNEVYVLTENDYEPHTIGIFSTEEKMKIFIKTMNLREDSYCIDIFEMDKYVNNLQNGILPYGVGIDDRGNIKQCELHNNPIYEQTTLENISFYNYKWQKYDLSNDRISERYSNLSEDEIYCYTTYMIIHAKNKDEAIENVKSLTEEFLKKNGPIDRSLYTFHINFNYDGSEYINLSLDRYPCNHICNVVEPVNNSYIKYLVSIRAKDKVTALAMAKDALQKYLESVQ